MKESKNGHNRTKYNLLDKNGLMLDSYIGFSEIMDHEKWPSYQKLDKKKDLSKINSTYDYDYKYDWKSDSLTLYQKGKAVAFESDVDGYSKIGNYGQEGIIFKKGDKKGLYFNRKNSPRLFLGCLKTIRQ